MKNRFMGLSASLLFLMPVVALASSEEHAAPPQSIPNAVWLHAINVAIFLFILYRLLRAPVRSFLVKRQDTIREALERSEIARIEAERQNEIYRQRLSGLSAEIAALRSQTEASARAEAEQLVSRANANAARIETDIQRLLNDELNRARFELRGEAIEVAVKLAEGILTRQITEADQRRLAEEYLQRVGQSSTEIH